MGVAVVLVALVLVAVGFSWWRFSRGGRGSLVVGRDR